MRATLVRVKCDGCQGGWSDVDGFHSPDVWRGLAVNPMHVHGVDGRVMPIDGWVVTHERSGIAVAAGYESRELAEHALGLLGDIPGVDWTLPAGDLQSPVLKVAMAEVLRRAQGLATGMGGGTTDLEDV